MEVLRFFVALFMAIFVPLNGFFFPDEDNKNLTYSEFEKTQKQARKYGEFNPNENDIFVDAAVEGGNGTRDLPFATVEQAKAKAKELRANGIREKITVWIAEGTYIFEDTLVFDSTDAENVVYRACPNEKVEFSGAVNVSDWSEDIQNGVRVFTAEIPENLYFDAVTKDGKVLPKTRYPETGYLTIEKEDHSDALFTTENTFWEYTLCDKAFVGNSSYNPAEIKNVENVIVRILHYWVNDLHYLTDYDAKTNKYYIENPAGMTIKTGDRYYFENVYTQLDSPGEWYFDIELGKLYYVPQDGETVENTVLNVCVNDKLISMSENKNIEFFGITFCNTNFSYPEKLDDTGWLSAYGIRFPQAEIDVEGAVEVTNADGINFTNCNFFNIGNTALKFNKYVKNSAVKSCYFKNIGANGVFVHGENAAENEKITENITVYDNKIESYGRNWQAAIGVLITHARNCTVGNNEISDGYYTAISVGWVWGYDYSVTENIKIQDNLIYNIGQGWLSDMGGIYTLGKQAGTVISGNVIYDVAADSGKGGYGGWGIYLDEGSSEMLVENNLVYNCGSQSFHIHYGKDNLVRNNIFALSGKSQMRISRNEEHKQIHLESNIFLTDNNAAYVVSAENNSTDNNNLYWDLHNGKYVYSAVTDNYKLPDKMYDSIAKMAGIHVNAVYENPQFKDAANGDFRIAESNEAIKKIGFEVWDYTKAGTASAF